MDIEDAWERFIRSEGGSFAKGSLDGKMDTIAAQLQEMSTDLTRLTNLIPDLSGKGGSDAQSQDDLDEDAILGMLEPLAGGGAEGSPDEGAPEEGASEEEGADEGSAPDEEDMPGGEEDEDAVEKAADPESASSEGMMPPVPGDAPIDEPVDAPADGGMEPPAPGDLAEPVDDVVPDGEEVERIEPAGQEGIPPEGVPDLLDEINATQPDGLLNVYDRFVEGMRRAAEEAAGKGDLASVSNIAGAQNAIQAIWRGQVAPVMDGLEGGDRFTRSCAEPEVFVKSGRKVMNGERMDDTVASSHEVPPIRTSSEGEESTTGASNAATAPAAPEGTVDGSGAPHALNNDNDTTAENPASFEKSGIGAGEVADVSDEAGTDPVAKCDTCTEHTEKSASATPPDNGEGMTPLGEDEQEPGIGDDDLDAYMKSLEEIEAYPQDYVDDTEEQYIDPVRKSVPSFREVMAESPDERFLLGAAMRRGPHLTVDEFYRGWQERRMAKSMNAGQPIEGMDPVQGSDDFEKTDGAATAGTEGLANARCSDSFAESTAGQAGPVGNVEDAMQKSAEDPINDMNGAFSKADEGSAETGTTRVRDELQGPTCDSSSETGLDDVDTKMRKSQENGKPIASMREMMAFRKSAPVATGRPDCVATVHGDLRRPDEDPSAFVKSDAPKVRMGFGVDPSEVVARDWEEYRVYKARRGFNRHREVMP